MKKFWATILCVIMCITSLNAFACKKPNNVNTDDWVNESGKEAVELTWFVDLDTFNKEFKDTLVDREIFRKTGVKIKFTSSDSVTGQSKLNSMILGNQLTDLVSTPAESSAHVQMIKGKYIWDMKSLFSTYTDVKDFIPDDMYKWCSYTDGKLYELRTHFFGDDCTDGELLTNTVLVASGKYLDEYNINPETDFVTMDKLIETLEKVKRGEDAKGNKTFIPFYSYSGGEEFSEFLAIPREDAEGNYQDWYEREEAKELAVQLNKMYRKGLLTEASYNSLVDMEEAILDGRTFLIMMNFASQQYFMWDDYLDNGNMYYAVNPPRNANGDDPMLTCWAPNGYLATCISKRSKNADRALDLLNYLYSEEGQILVNFGIKNDSYTVAEDGLYYQTNKYYSMDDEEIADYYGHAWYETLVSNTPYLRSLTGIPSIEPAKFTQEIFSYFNQFAYNTRALNAIHPNDATTGLPAVMQQANAKFSWVEIIVSAEAGLSDADARAKVLSTYNTQLTARNTTKRFDEVKEYYNNKFKSNKEKLGIDYIWPSNQK